MNNVMKAVVCTAYGQPEVLQVQDAAIPIPKDDELLVRVHASSITTADSMMRTGNPRYVRLFLGLSKPKHPITGTGFAGTIAAAGKAVQNFEIGDAVYGETTVSFGTNAEYVCVPANGIVRSLPAHLSFEAAAVMCDGPVTSLNFLKNLAGIQPGQKLLINGASGSLGVAAIQIAKYMGAEVTAVCSAANAELVQSLGADYVIDYTTTDFTQAGKLYDVVYDTVGKSSFAACRQVLTPTGIYMCPVLSMTILGQMMMNRLRGGKQVKFDATGLKPAHTIKDMLRELEEMMANGEYNPVIQRRYVMDEITEAHSYIDTGRKRGNIVLTVTEGRHVEGLFT